MGSDSDMPVMSKAAAILDKLGVEYEMKIISAHREPDVFFEYARSAEERGFKVIIAGAGMAAHLPGMCAAIFPMPVIGIPMHTTSLGGRDSLYSIVQMPSGIPVATVAINGGANAENYEKLEKAGAVGFLILTGTPLDKDEDRLPDYRTLRGVKNPKLPCAVIHYLDAMELVERGASRARLVLQQKKIRRTSKNIILRIPGTEQPEKILTLTAHYDSVPQGPGAYDNMAGAAIIMELAHYFAENRPKRTLECIWFGAEELGLCGSRAYVKAHEAELAQHRFNMNVDLAGQAIGGTVLGVAATKEACDVIMEHLKQADKGVSLINNIWSSDSNTFAWKGIPAMTLNRDGFGMHTCHDTIDWISAWSLNRSAGVLGEIAEYLADAEPFPFEREIPADFAERLKVYFGE
jgi:aminopeptidase YwaD